MRKNTVWIGGGFALGVLAKLYISHQNGVK